MASDDDFAPDNLAAAGAVGIRPDPGYQWPSDIRTREALEKWRDQKLGVIIHWGIYSYIGQGGSWSLHREHLGDFTDPPASWNGSEGDYQTWYYDQAREFKGEDFDPVLWAKSCAQAGMRYMIFTAKHHDGFAMYDTQFSNCKCTSEESALGRDIFREVAEAFRSEGLEIGVYFSKADWHHPGYWDRARKIHDRFHNYDIGDNPKKWESFVNFTHNQISELLSNYGSINVLWLDAGWVCEPEEPIEIDQIGRIARELQPDILVVDREVHGPEENYRTPEQELPDRYLDYPWESCITMTKSWCSLRVDDPVKPTEEIIGNLIKIVARGGNYLIGIGPDATGRMSVHIQRSLAELGEWMDIYGDGIYGSRAIAENPLRETAGLEFYAVTGADGATYVFALLPDEKRKYIYEQPASFSILGKYAKAELITKSRDFEVPVKYEQKNGEIVTTVDIEPNLLHGKELPSFALGWRLTLAD